MDVKFRGDRAARVPIRLVLAITVSVSALERTPPAINHSLEHEILSFPMACSKSSFIKRQTCPLVPLILLFRWACAAIPEFVNRMPMQFTV